MLCQGGAEPPAVPEVGKGVALLDEPTYSAMLPDEKVHAYPHLPHLPTFPTFPTFCSCCPMRRCPAAPPALLFHSPCRVLFHLPFRVLFHLLGHTAR